MSDSWRQVILGGKLWELEIWILALIKPGFEYKKEENHLFQIDLENDQQAKKRQ